MYRPIQRSASATLPAKTTPPIPAPARQGARQNARPSNKRRPDENRLLSALNPASGQANVRNGGGLSIKGKGSGPFVVVGSNFAPGTTAADIQSALEPVSGPILRCWVTAQHPVVTAEITFAERQAAEGAVANFHNQRVSHSSQLLMIYSNRSGRRSDPLIPPKATCEPRRVRALQCPARCTELPIV